jgi:4-hydroxybenzoate polyprenyltransferase/phosphoglycolate phosphatase-like HAD superfamily hydrolase
MDTHSDNNANHMLVVDLDGTLIHSDMLFELGFALPRSGRAAVTSFLKARPKTRAELKQALGAFVPFDAALLPYNKAVIQRIKEWRAGGGRVALVTATDQRVADCIADHLGLFDEVHGSDGVNNLKGAAKAEFITRRYGAGRFDYIGDAAADYENWQAAKRAFVAHHSLRFLEKVRRLKTDAEQVDDGHQAGVEPYIKALRPHQWLKNLLIFLPLLAAHRFGFGDWLHGIIAFCAFNAVASAIYIFNDLVDLNADRAHIRKRKRPFASGRVPIAHGVIMSALLLVSGLALSFSFEGYSFLMVMVGYIILTTAYSLYLKKKLMIDVCVLATLYAVRVVAGGAATGIELSFYLLAFCIFLFLSLASIKRQAELLDSPLTEGELLPGRAYTPSDMPVFMAMSIVAGYTAVLVLMLYLNSENVTKLYSAPELLWIICPIFLYWVSRVVMLTQRGLMDDDPVIFAVKDRTSYICAGLIFGILTISSLL